MAKISYGFGAPPDLFAKFKREGDKLGPSPHADDIFNFFVTGAALNDWVCRLHVGEAVVEELRIALRRDGTWEQLPAVSASWIEDAECLPNKHCDVRRHIFNSLRICWESAGASKHFRWEGRVRAIDSKPIVRSWYQYFFTSRAPDLYIDYDGEVYGLSQVKAILTQFYSGLLLALEKQEGERSAI